MDQKEALGIVLAAAEMVGRMIEDQQTLSAVEFLRSVTDDDARTLRNLEWTDQSGDVRAPAGNYLLAQAQVHNTLLHVQAIRVKRHKSGEQMAFNKTMQDDLNKVFAVYDYSYMTTTIPGYKGDFVIYAHPYGD